MTGNEIKDSIEQLNEEIKGLMNPGYFTLNKAIEERMSKIEALQSQCAHEFNVNGYCIYCGKKQD